MQNTGIEWCDATFNPITGCKHGCKYCYARQIAARFGGFDGYGCEEDQDRVERLGKYELQKPAYIKRGTERKMVKAPFPFKFEPTLHRYRLEELQHWKRPRNVFVGSMADVFGSWVPDEWIEEVFAACKKAPQHRFIFLSKNPARYARLNLPIGENFWFGASATNREMFATAIDSLEPVENAFLSIEPLLESVYPFSTSTAKKLPKCFILGAETGNRKEKIVPDTLWVHEILLFCKDHKIPVFMKDSLIPIVGEGKVARNRKLPWDNPGRTPASKAACQH